MKLFTKQQYERLIENGKMDMDQDHTPVVKLFTPDAACTWLISAIYPDNTDIAFGLADLGLGFPEMGDIYLPEIAELRGRAGLPVERDLHFEGEFALSVYARLARKFGCIYDNRIELFQTEIIMQDERKK
jgi:hypothetical protein